MPFFLFGLSFRLWFFSAKASGNGLQCEGMALQTRMVWFLRNFLDEVLNLCAVLSADFVEGAVRLLVTRFIPLTPKDLGRWEMDVEEWINQEENEEELWEYELRVCVLFCRGQFADNPPYPTAVCGACAVDLVNPVQRLCHSHPAGILRQCRRCVSPCLIRALIHGP